MQHYYPDISWQQVSAQAMWTTQLQEPVVEQNCSSDTVERTPVVSSHIGAESKGGVGLRERTPVTLYLSCDDESLSPYQCLVRKQIELFAATTEDVSTNAQGRNRPIVLGQVGIRCNHCSVLPPKQRARGAMYYPRKLEGLYQAAQNMASGHLCQHCHLVPAQIKRTLQKLRENKLAAGGGKKYWAHGIRALGVTEDKDGLKFE